MAGVVLAPPQLNRDGFRWRAKLYHLTYATHIPHLLLLALLSRVSGKKVVGWSIVHEASDDEHPYDHTHFAWMWDSAVDLLGSRLMDYFDGTVTIHPNIETKKSLAWMQLLFTEYHRGIKAAAVGAAQSRKYVQPVAGPWQELPAAFEWHEYIVTEAANAVDLIAGVHAAGIRARSVSDVHLLQKHKRPAPFDHNYTRDKFKPLALPADFVNGTVGTLQIWGPIRLGKTEWALAQFDEPLLVTNRDTLKKFRPNFHDGIVIDKMLFNDWSVLDCEALTDYTQPAQIRVMYGVAEIPKRTRKIIVTNERDAWPRDPHGQIVGRRVAQLHVTSRLY